MEYEFKALCIATGSNSLNENDARKLNAYFETGWEYIDSICQAFGTSAGRGNGSVIVVLKKKKVI